METADDNAVRIAKNVTLIIGVLVRRMQTQPSELVNDIEEEQPSSFHARIEFGL